MDATQEIIEAAQEEAISDPPEYLAFKVGGGDAGRKVAALEIRTTKPLWAAPGYNWLLYTLEDGEAGTFLALIFSCMQVYVKGRNLRPIGAAIRRQRCAVLWEYNSQRWPLPSDKSAPFITSLVVEMPAHSQEAIANAQGRAENPA